VAEGDLVAVRITARGRHTGAPFPPGIAAAGRAIEWREQHIFRIEDGRIVEHWGVFDTLAILQQLGAMPTPG
jgi:predicted ester cyclase